MPSNEHVPDQWQPSSSNHGNPRGSGHRRDYGLTGGLTGTPRITECRRRSGLVESLLLWLLQVIDENHVELYNAFNDVFYNNPNLSPNNAEFGKVNSQNNLPTNIQIGTKIIF